VSDSPFRRRTVVILTVVCALSLATSLLLLVFGPELSSPPTPSTNGYSRSAVGHKALVEVLRASGIPVVVSRMRTPGARESASLVIVAEPDLDDDGSDLDRGRRLDEVLRAGPAVLLVLPKRTVVADSHSEGWVRESGLGSTERAREVLAHAARGASVVDAKPARGWHPGPLGVVPDVEEPRLVEPGVLHPLLEAPGAGVLVGTTDVEGSTVAVLSDADLVATHGLVRGDNAILVTRLVDRLREGRQGAVVLDETLHGFEYEPGIWRELFRFPLVLSVVAAVVAGLLLVWSGIGRFGAPEPPPPPIPPGKAFLLSSTADLLRRGGHVGLALDRYLASTVQDVARATHAPPTLEKEPLREWLERVGEARGASSTIEELEEAVAAASAEGARDPRKVTSAAKAVHAWRKEMIDGPDRDS
jgi:hypothetical protein